MNTSTHTSNNKWIDFKDLPEKDQEIEYSYTNIDKFIRLSLGENASYSNALFDGNYSISLEEAQQRKYKFICDNLGIKKDSKVLDLGCGWGGFLKYLKQQGAAGTGITLSTGQVEACKRSGLTAYYKDMRYISVEELGSFDAITAIGSFDHVATRQDFLNGVQDTVYDNFFKTVAGFLAPGKRFYIQSMVFSKNMMPYEKIDINAPVGSDAYIMALILKHFPNSWLPYGGEHIIRAASPYFKTLSHSSGRLDYIETDKRWKKKYLQFNFRKYLWFASLLPKYLLDKEFRYQLQLLKIRPNRLCFEREIMDHSRIVFERL